MKTIANMILEVLQGPVPEVCPIKEAPPTNQTLGTVPEDGRKLLVLWHDLYKKTAKFGGRDGNDQGVWFRHSNETDGVKEMIRNIIRVEEKISYRVHIDFYADWKYGYSGG